MGQALYRKYRSKSLDEVVGQEHITTTLKNALKTGKVSHAYLLTGPKGVGKTSVARILAFEVNGLPYEDTKAHLDIIEIDAASNRRIDEIRDLRDKVNILPSSAKYKVYIIDEVHMLTREAFNALLKTLEEPPAHVIFILATTEAHRLPDTIISRTQHFSFKPIPVAAVVDHLRTIAKAENIAVDDSALQLIAEHGGGSFRDSISLLDQARHTTATLDSTVIEHLLGVAPATMLETVQSAAERADFGAIITSLAELRNQGFQAAEIAKQLAERFRASIITNNRPSPDDIQFLRNLVEVPASRQPEQALELTLLDFGLTHQPLSMVTDLPVPPTPIDVPKPQLPEPPVQTPKVISTVSKSEESEKSDTSVKAQRTIDTPKTSKDENHAPNGFTIELWPVVLSIVKKQYNTLYGILRMAEADVANNTLTLSFKFAFHQKQINDQKNKKLITDIIHQHTGDTIKVVCETISKQSPASKTNPTTSIDTVSNIFGGAEVLES